MWRCSVGADLLESLSWFGALPNAIFRFKSCNALSIASSTGQLLWLMPRSLISLKISARNLPGHAARSPVAWPSLSRLELDWISRIDSPDKTYGGRRWYRPCIAVTTWTIIRQVDLERAELWRRGAEKSPGLTSFAFDELFHWRPSLQPCGVG